MGVTFHLLHSTHAQLIMSTVAAYKFDSVTDNQATSRAWKNGAEKYLLTLQRADSETAWGFSCSGGQDLEAWGGLMSGVCVKRHEKGLWLGVESVRDDAAAKKGGLMKGDFITAINGRIVFHMKPEDVSRLIRNSGKILYLDIERKNSKRLLYCNGLHQYSFNFLFEDNWEMKKLLF